eukprot:TRINITY_DN27605_c0_g1_i1.p1 TRINITY_DN27605_c0_g1~~TRINITY_DN27605_c0_g1_i1.p1  ORF type:complete len:547 (+),score=115.72 TRINITY_DN27605_c0_g1_i1:193-1641(+)
MSNNAGVVKISNNTAQGVAGEIGRAQVVQAEACQVEAETDMNPVLLKPASDRSSQVVVNGVALGNFEAKQLWKKNSDAQNPLRVAAREALSRLRQNYDAVVIEGAGSCAEVNLRDRDFVNFETARQTNASVILVCDIEKGGVFAQVVGTLECLEESDRSLIKAIIINKFRGDLSLFDDGRQWIEQKTKLPVLGVIPYFDPLDMFGDSTRCVLPSEDALYRSSRVDPVMESVVSDDCFNVAVLLLPRIANHTDFAPLEAHSTINLDWLRTPRDLSTYDIVIIPGSKSVISDLEWVQQNWSKPLHSYASRGDGRGLLLGVCGGYQMLGQSVSDPNCIDSIGGSKEAVSGLGLLPVKTEMLSTKELKNVRGSWSTDILLPNNTHVRGYEIHVGRTVCTSADSSNSVIVNSDGEVDGCMCSSSGIPVIGTYLHGLFDGGNADKMLSHVTGRPPSVVEERDPFVALSDHFTTAMGDENVQKLLSFAR